MITDCEQAEEGEDGVPSPGRWHGLDSYFRAAEIVLTAEHTLSPGKVGVAPFVVARFIGPGALPAL
jgi:hypothetical protein